jgi:hypothetical protein
MKPENKRLPKMAAAGRYSLLWVYKKSEGTFALQLLPNVS